MAAFNAAAQQARVGARKESWLAATRLLGGRVKPGGYRASTRNLHTDLVERIIKATVSFALISDDKFEV
jgi:hypothetical protein